MTETTKLPDNNLSISGKRKNPRTKTPFAGRVTQTFVYTFTAVVAIILLILVGFVALKSSKLFQNTNFWDFIFKGKWDPENNIFGIGTIILMTIMLLLVAMVFAIPITIFSTLFISEYLSKKYQKIVMTIVKLLAGIPSVVFGLFAREHVGALFRLMGAPSNDNLMVAGLTMAFMAIPTMVSLSYNAVQAVPEGYRFGSLGLGISKEKTTFSIVRKSAWAKIISAIIMGMSRVIGETMAIMMIAGNSTGGFNTTDGIIGFLFSSIRTLAATIGLEMLENKGQLHESALYAIGLFLFILVFVINLSILIISNIDNWKRNRRAKQEEKMVAAGKTSKAYRNYRKYSSYELIEIVNNRSENKICKKMYSGSLMIAMWLSTALVISFTFWILGTVAIRGLGGLVYSDAFLSINGQAGILAALLTTVMLILATLVFAVPLALGAAIYLSEYSRSNSKVVKTLRFSIGLLASTPSIVFGIFGLSVFIVWMKIPFSILAAALTMTIVVLPMLISNFEDALTSVPSSYREAGAALGMSKVKRLFKIVLPNAMEGIITGTILAMARIIGESAPVYLTLGTAMQLPTEGFLSSGATLTTGIYMLSAEAGPGRGEAIAYLMSLMTIVLVLTLNFTSGRVSALVTGAKRTPLVLIIRGQISAVKHYDYKISLGRKFNKVKAVYIVFINRLKPSVVKEKWTKWRARRKAYKKLKKGEKS
ncbi:phosphate ABC transporter permease [Mesoplasma syrphidae]|uniref:Phosphate ABC transporter permease n=1 Tax=Mesoplasma syrphidae TaxID=225999 RepID=A0A2K9BJ87_9MOLU|nr:phosphate ABC transporter permease PstA [Mesoplasma syrphidae]AUF83411.1 phosphate ABC transporter permease [Mesoplasma syrphidae]